MSEAKPAASHAHSLDPVKDGKLADASKSLGDQFARAKAMQLEKQAAVKQQQPANSNMSFAKGVEMDIKANKLDNASKDISAQFKRAKAAQLAARSGAANDMNAPAPSAQMHLRPGGKLQRDVDGPIYRQQLTDYAKQINDARKAGSRKNHSGLTHDRTKDHDRGR